MKELNRDMHNDLYSVTLDMDFMLEATGALGNRIPEEDLLHHLRDHVREWSRKIQGLADDAERLVMAAPREERAPETL